MMAKGVFIKGKASYYKYLKMVSFPKLLLVSSLAVASRMSKVLICLSLNWEFFSLTTLSPAGRRFRESKILKHMVNGERME